jgi:hypothetical protein
MSSIVLGWSAFLSITCTCCSEKVTRLAKLICQGKLVRVNIDSPISTVKRSIRGFDCEMLSFIVVVSEERQVYCFFLHREVTPHEHEHFLNLLVDIFLAFFYSTIESEPLCLERNGVTNYKMYLLLVVVERIYCTSSNILYCIIYIAGTYEVVYSSLT